MFRRELAISLLTVLLILKCIPAASCSSPPIVYVAGDGSGDFNCGGNNDQIQINQALQFVADNDGYTTVHLKGPFTYVIDSCILISSNTILEGDSSAVIKLADHASWDSMIPLIRQKNDLGNSNISIRGFEIDGNYASNSEIALGMGYYNIMYFSYCNDVKVYNMYMHDGLGDGLRTSYSKNIQFYNNTIYKLGHDGLFALRSENVEAWNNRVTCRTNSALRIWNSKNVKFHDNVLDSFNDYNGPGIQIEENSTEGTVTDVEVYGNIINNTYGPGIWIIGYGAAYPREEAQNVRIHNNIFLSTGINPSIDWVGGIVTSGFYDTLIENNVFDGTYHAAVIGMYPEDRDFLKPQGDGYSTIVRNNIIINTQERIQNPNGTGAAVINYEPGIYYFLLENNCLYNNTGEDYENCSSTKDIYVNPLVANLTTHDYHLQSTVGRWNGETWVNDSLNSLCIDSGYRYSDYFNEPEPNGKRINIGSEGNTIYASKSAILPESFPTANFSSNITNGTVPLTVQFTDLSKNVTAWKWDFGDGYISTEQNPAHTYSVAGNYIVNLRAINANGINSKFAAITVLEKIPVANFSSNITQDRVPLTVQFKDQSQNATLWNWDFGDGNTSTENNPINVYSMVGNYNVTLTVMNAVGINTTTKLGYINAQVPPVSDFSASPIVGIMPMNVSFTDTSAGNPASWSWNFGDGNTSIEQNPSHIYSKVGKYTVSLTVMNAAGSNTSTKTSYIDVEVPPVANFSANRTLGMVPVVVMFTDRSSGTPTSWNWNFGDGNTSTEKNPTKVYGKVGKYNVTLKVTNAVGNNTSTKSNYIDAQVLPVANFSASPVVGIMPINVSFTDTSAGNPTSWYWDFGDKNISTKKNPSHIYKRVGKYNVSLTVKNAIGSSTSKKIRYIDVEVLPVANFSANTTIGKVPLVVRFSDRSSGAPTFRKWDFGDGNISTEINPTNVYGKVRKYNVTLTVMNAVGRSTSKKLNYINAQVPPVANFFASPIVGIMPMNVSFTDTSAGNPTSWYWNFGDGTNSTQKNPSHIYNKVGKYTVSLIVRNAAGVSTSTKTSYIDVEVPPVANFSSNRTIGKVPVVVMFTDRSSGTPSSWNWNFGDGDTSTEKNPTKVYGKVGKYNVTLTVTNAVGNNTTTKSSYIDAQVPPEANFSAFPTLGIMPMNVSFTDTSAGNPSSWSWDFGDGNISAKKDPSYIYNRVGKFNVSLTVKNTIGSSTSKKVRYIDVGVPPVSSYSANTTIGKVPLVVRFTDRSSGAPTSWNWDFGDGNSSTIINPTNVYGKVGKFDVTLKVTNAVGNNTSTKSNYIDAQTPPEANFSAFPTVGIMPMNVSFTDTSTGNPTSWSWNFGDGNTSIVQNPSHVYGKVGKYTVSLKVSNAAGINASTKTSYIDVGVSPVANFSANKTIGTVPTIVKFTDKSSGIRTSWNWDFGDGDTSTEQNPIHVYSKAGNYTTILKVSNVYGTDSKMDIITVQKVTPTITWNSPDNITYGTPLNNTQLNANASVTGIFVYTPMPGTVLSSGAHTLHVDFTPDDTVNNNETSKNVTINVSVKSTLPSAIFNTNLTSGIVPLSVQFTDLSENAAEWNWSFGDETNSTQRNPIHTYLIAGNYTVTLLVSSENSSDSRTRYITVASEESVSNLSVNYNNILSEASPENVYSNSAYIDVGGLVNGSSYRDVIWLDLSQYTSDRQISNATLSLFWHYPGSPRLNDTIVEIYRPASAFNSSYVSWNKKNKGMNWTNPGGDWYDLNGVLQGSTPYVSITLKANDLASKNYCEFNVTNIVREYISGKYTNTGFLIKARTEKDNHIAFYSAYCGYTSKVPKLKLAY